MYENISPWISLLNRGGIATPLYDAEKLRRITAVAKEARVAESAARLTSLMGWWKLI